MRACKPDTSLLRGEIGHAADRMHSDLLAFIARISAELRPPPNCGRTPYVLMALFRQPLLWWGSTNSREAQYKPRENVRDDEGEVQGCDWGPEQLVRCGAPGGGLVGSLLDLAPQRLRNTSGAGTVLVCTAPAASPMLIPTSPPQPTHPPVLWHVQRQRVEAHGGFAGDPAGYCTDDILYTPRQHKRETLPGDSHSSAIPSDLEPHGDILTSLKYVLTHENNSPAGRSTPQVPQAPCP